MTHSELASLTDHDREALLDFLRDLATLRQRGAAALLAEDPDYWRPRLTGDVRDLRPGGMAPRETPTR